MSSTQVKAILFPGLCILSIFLHMIRLSANVFTGSNMRFIPYCWCETQCSAKMHQRMVGAVLEKVVLVLNFKKGDALYVLCAALHTDCS